MKPRYIYLTAMLVYSSISGYSCQTEAKPKISVTTIVRGASPKAPTIRSLSSPTTRPALPQQGASSRLVRHKIRSHSARHKTRPPADLLQQLARHLRSVVDQMKQMGFPLDDSYCHVGAAYTVVFLTRHHVDAHLFQPLPAHMLSYFDYQGKRYFIDQTMAQFFKKDSPAHKVLMKQGGFFGTPDDFYRFYYQHVDHVKAWDDYEDGGFLPTKEKPNQDGILSYRMWEKGVDWKSLNSREVRTRRVLRSWYIDFNTDTSYNQAAGLYWTAQYYYNQFRVQLQLPPNPPP